MDALAREISAIRANNVMRTWPARAPKQVTFDQVDGRAAPPNTVPRTPTVTLLLAQELRPRLGRRCNWTSCLPMLEMPPDRRAGDPGAAAAWRWTAAYLRQMSLELQGRMENACCTTSTRWRVRSSTSIRPPQLQRILFEQLKLPPGKKTKTGYSTDVSVLENLAVEHELPQQHSGIPPPRRR